jgi:8-oxo-dGTP pyrophosphatase MutT (NUDIX family)
MHFLEVFRYCPKCGSAHFAENNFKSKKCLDCGFVYYFNSSAAVAVFITNEKGQLLVARRAKDPAQGTLDLPGGFVDLDETAEEAIQREVEEETGLVITRPEYLFSLPNIYLYSGLDVHTLDLFYRSKTHATLLQPKDDVAELFFLHPEEIDPGLFGLASIRKAIRIWLTEYTESKNDENLSDPNRRSASRSQI